MIITPLISIEWNSLWSLMPDMEKHWKFTQSKFEYLTYTDFLLGLAMESKEQNKKFTQIWKNLQKHGLKVCVFHHIC